MKPPLISNSNLNLNYNSKTSNNSNKQQIIAGNIQKVDSVSFGSNATTIGKMKHGIQGGLTKAFNFIDNSSFFVEFLIVDIISMVLPRILVGLNRDKDKTGQYNYKAAKEEAGREVLSGPSMNLIPMGVLAAFSAFKPASRIERGTLNDLTTTMTKIIEKTPTSKQTDKKLLNEKMIDKIFDENFGTEFKNDKPMKHCKRIRSEEYKKVFRKALLNATDEKTDKETNAKFVKIVNGLNNRKKEAPKNPGALKINGNEIEAKELFKDFRNYSKDILEKFTKKEGNLKTLTKNRLMLKTGTAVAAFFAVGSFLRALPKFYQQKGLSPAQESAHRAQAEANGGVINENK